LFKESGPFGASATRGERASRSDPEQAGPSSPSSWPRVTISEMGPVPADRDRDSAAEAEGDAVQLPVVAVLDQTPDVRSFRLARPKGFDFEAGQYLTLGLSVNRRPMSRSFSISSAPETADYLEITVKRRGLVTGALHSMVGVGSLLSVRPPAGRFVYPAGDRRPLLLLAGGIGCTPLMSMLRHAVAADPSRRVTLLLSARTPKDVLFRQELALLRQRNPQLRVGVTLTRERRSGFSFGRIDAQLLRRAAPDPLGTLYYVCGPAPMREELKTLLADLGASPDQIRWEVFKKPAAGGTEATKPRPASAAEAPVARPASRDGLHRDAIAPRGDSILKLAPGLAPRPLRRGGEPSQRDGIPGPTAPLPATASSGTSNILLFRRKEMAREILRFRRSEILLHWAIAVPFMVCLATGVALKFAFNLDSGFLRDAVSWLHRIAGVAFIVLPVWATIRNWTDYRVHLFNIREGWTWTLDDLKWLLLMGPAAISKRIVLPEQRKFNAAEKLNFMMGMVSYPVFVVTGVLLLLPGIRIVPWIVHVGMAAAMAPLILGHIYMALVNPGTRVGLSGMFSGRVDREWARQHYRRWYREHFEDDGTPKVAGPATEPRSGPRLPSEGTVP
jgi:formate dehydrogenase gamma subunit